ncbi:SusC/RagA family TonB-linked outer membrane protein [Membranihabitans maritimus]|uniref:SusC/RagA family TonB-linked outer membrane protein n=1 Tax=Membranihabitans maritimus TaxID=2904244 RepID=UPI001F01404B|nr:SusC/RagA family TonB-linked outer membrane protein [Membranihabitans maritimus]
MRITTLVTGVQMIFSTFLMANFAEGQKVTLDFSDVSVEEIFKEIERQADVSFVYKPSVINRVSIESIHAKNESLELVLSNLESETVLRFKKIGNMIGVSRVEGPPIRTDEEELQVQKKNEMAQNFALIDVSGVVVDAAGEALIGVNISVKGTGKGASTDFEGKFVLSDVEEDAVLTVSYIGYKTLEVPLDGRSSLTITLEEDSQTLDEVVVVGYGTQKKSSLTGAITKIENKTLDQMPTGRVENALAGRMSGVSIVNNRNTPGAAPLIRIRGAGSIDAGNSPLVVIDGFPGGDLGQLNMNDIESIEVLKDASAAAIYGSRGAGGVIIITTKRGKGKPTLNFNAYYGVSSPMLHDDWLTGEEWYDYLVKYQNREFAWAGGDVSLPMFGDERRPSNYQVNPLTYELPQTVWQDEITRNAPIANYNLSVGGGSDKTRYYVSASYKDEEGNILTASYKQYSLRANVDVEINSWIDAGFELSPSYSKTRTAGSNMVSLVKYPPFVAPQDENGNYPRTQDYIPKGHSGQASPYVYLYGTNNTGEYFKNIARGFISLNLAEGLVLKSSVGTNLTYNSSDYFRGGAGDNLIATAGSASDYKSINLVNENTLNYNKTIAGMHDITGLLGASYQRQTSRSTAIGAVGGSFNNEIIQTLNNAIINPSATRTTKSEWGLVSYFGRLNYAYDSRYLLSASLRTDASSRFGPDNKWAIFPAMSVAWRISEENFLRDNSIISEMKLRASYGATGNFNIGDFAYLGRVGAVNYSPNNVLVNGQAPVSFENAMLGWEKTTSYDIGLDVGIMNNRFNFSLDFYDKTTSDLLYNVSIPAITGFTSTITNVGEINNKGVELELTTRNIVGTFNWTTSFNASKNKNEVVDLGAVSERIYNHSLGMSWILREGDPMFSYYGYQTKGVYQTASEVEASPHLPGAKPGNPIVEDTNGDGKIDPQDKVVLGNFQPKMLLGMVNDFSWKDFDLSVAIQSSLGAKIYNFENQYYEGNTLGAMRRSLVENQWWSPEEPGDGKTPAAALSQLIQYNANTDFYIENASFLTLKNINLGYTLPENIAGKAGMSRCRVYASVNNLLMIRDKNNRAYNPEGTTGGEISGINSIPGYNSGSEPIARIFAIGLNVGF